MGRKYSRQKPEEILSLEQANKEFFNRMRRLDQEDSAIAETGSKQLTKAGKKRHVLHR